MASDLLFSVGVDVTPLDTGVTQIERRLDAAGVKFAEAPRKFASESAKAFEQTFAAEERLARYRETEAFRRLSNEEKLSVLRQQAIGILTKAQAIEGQSAEKSDLLLQYEQKKSAIFDINQKIQAVSLAEQRKQTEEVDSQGKKYTGLSGTLEQIKKGFKDLGVSIQGAGLGVFFASMLSFGKQAINQAQEQRDLWERMRQPLDANTAAVARFGDALDGVKKGSVSWASFVIGFYNQIGESIGSAINRLRGVSEAQEKYNEQSAREGDLQLERAKRMKQQQFDEEKIRDLRKQNAEAARQYALEGMSDEQQLQALINRNVALRLQIADLQRNGQSNTVKFQQLEGELIQQNTALRAKDFQLIKDSADKQIAAITTIAPLAITHQEKLYNLKDQEVVLLREQQLLKEKGAKTDDNLAKLQANRVQQTMLEREWTDKISLDNERILEQVRLQYKEKTRGLTEVEAAVLRMYKLQTAEKENQAKIDELILVKKQKGLTPEQQKELDILLKQEKALEKQIGFAQENIDKAIERKKAEDLTLTPLEKQVKALQAQGIGVDQIVATLVSRGASEEEILAILDAQKKKIEEQEQALIRVETLRRRGTEYDQQSDVALEGVISRLKSQLDAIRAKNAQLPVNQRDPFINALEAEYRNAVNELSERRAIRSYANMRGEDAARFKYGDTNTEQALRDARDTQVQIVRIMQRIEDMMKFSEIFPYKNPTQPNPTP